MYAGLRIAPPCPRRASLVLLCAATIAWLSSSAVAWQPEPSGTDPAPQSTTETTNRGTRSDNDAAPDAQKSPLVRLDPQHEVWVDGKQRRLIVGGQICLRQGMLEMFACPRGTKEHESVVAVNAPAYLVHTGLLAIGAKSGHPVQYDPVYQAAAGDTIQVDVLWRNEDGEIVRQRAQQLIRRVDTHEPMKHEWVFAGSGFWEDEESGKRYYQAEGGELICLSNFSTATLDLNVESPRDNADLLYEASPDNIPPLGTKVRLVLSVAKGANPDDTQDTQD